MDNSSINRSQMIERVQEMMKSQGGVERWRPCKNFIFKFQNPNVDHVPLKRDLELINPASEDVMYRMYPHQFLAYFELVVKRFYTQM